MSITIEELKKMNNVNIIDIRDETAYKINHIKTAINISFNDLIINPTVFLDKNRVYYIYCYTGVTSKKICEILTKQGYKVVNVIGRM